MKLTACLHWLWSASHGIRRRLAARTGGKTILLVTHRERVAQWAGQVLRLQNNNLS